MEVFEPGREIVETTKALNAARHALAQVGIDTPVSLPREKTGLRPTTATVEELFTPDLDEKVATVFRREIAAFRYEDRSRRS